MMMMMTMMKMKMEMHDDGDDEDEDGDEMMKMMMTVLLVDGGHDELPFSPSFDKLSISSRRNYLKISNVLL